MKNLGCCLATVASVGMLAGCAGGKSPDPSVSVNVSPSVGEPETSPALSFYTAAQLAMEVNCTGFETTPDATFASDLGSCTLAGEEIVVGIYPTTEAIESSIIFKQGLLGGVSDEYDVVGLNWLVSCDSYMVCQGVSDQLGGEMRSYPKTE